MTRREQLDCYLGAVERRMERAAQTFGERSYSRDPLELVREVKEELEDVAGWASILWARLDDIERVLEAQLKISGKGSTPP
jgi:hypothetical protein